jgi:hypothetical protein
MGAIGSEVPYSTAKIARRVGATDIVNGIEVSNSKES